MAKRKNRVKPIEHHQAQLDALKTLEPISTPDGWRAFTDACVAVAIQALELVRRLEATGRLGRTPVDALYDLVRTLPDHVPVKGDEGEDDAGDTA